METEFLLAAAHVNARLFIGGDDEFILLQNAALSQAGVSIQHPAPLVAKSGSRGNSQLR